MYNQSEFLDASGNLKHEAVRAHFLRTGKLDGLKKGDRVWVEDFGFYQRATLTRRLPGDCWLAKLDIEFMGVKTVTVSVGNFGGKCV